MDTFSEVRLNGVHPLLAAKIHQLAIQLAEENIQIRITQGVRSWNTQAALYAQGRDPLDVVNKMRSAVSLAPLTPNENERTVTRCAPGFSQHQSGLAVDCAPFEEGIPDWNSAHPTWKRMEDVARSLGLKAGADFRTFVDAPHFEITGKWGSVPSHEQRQLLINNGMEAVWQESGL